MKRKPWTRTQIRALIKDYPKKSAAEISESLGHPISSIYQMAHQHGVKKSAAFLKSNKSGRLDGITGSKTRFSNGHVPFNKGSKGITGVQEACRATQFKPGRPASQTYNYSPIGSERLTKDGYLERKITDDRSLVPARRWVPVHRIIWQQANGAIPPGHILRFINGNKADIRLENLECLTKSENARRNVASMPKEIMDLHRLRGTLTKAINRRNKANEQRA